MCFNGRIKNANNYVTVTLTQTVNGGTMSSGPGLRHLQ